MCVDSSRCSFVVFRALFCSKSRYREFYHLRAALQSPLVFIDLKAFYSYKVSGGGSLRRQRSSLFLNADPGGSLSSLGDVLGGSFGLLGVLWAIDSIALGASDSVAQGLFSLILAAFL